LFVEEFPATLASSGMIEALDIRGVKKIHLSIIHPIHLKIYPSNPSISKNVG
jgi:hypothetical protein